MQVHAKPRYILFAGVNGAGKSTLFRSGLWHAGEGDAQLPRVNSDEILSAHGWDWADGLAQLRAGKEAVRMMKSFIEQRASFNQETTLAGKSIVREIQRAAKTGYEIVVHYVGVESPDIAISRIAHRVMTGGHDIAPEDVSKRYTASQQNLVSVVRFADQVFLFDNTRELVLTAAFSKGELTWIDDFPGVKWVYGAFDGTGLLDRDSVDEERRRFALDSNMEEGGLRYG